MSRFLTTLGVVALFACVGALPAAAASFNCHKAATDSEKTICAKPTLNILDQRMDHVYRSLLKLVGEAGQRDQFRADQLHWLNVRDACGGDADCLRATIRERIDELDGYISAVKAAH